MNVTTLCVDILHQVHAELQYQIQQGFIDVHEQLTELQLRPPTTQAISTWDFLQCTCAHDKTLSWQCIYSNNVPSGLDLYMCACIESAITMVTTTLYKQLYTTIEWLPWLQKYKRKQSLILVCLTSLRGLHFKVVVRTLHIPL